MNFNLVVIPSTSHVIRVYKNENDFFHLVKVIRLNEFFIEFETYEKNILLINSNQQHIFRNNIYFWISAHDNDYTVLLDKKFVNFELYGRTIIPVNFKTDKIVIFNEN